MKNYVKPSIELNKFDVEDIITVSGTIGNKESMSEEAKAIYATYLEDMDMTEEQGAANLVEFQW